jgi:hypothetical protein
MTFHLRDVCIKRLEVKAEFGPEMTWIVMASRIPATDEIFSEMTEGTLSSHREGTPGGVSLSFGPSQCADYITISD